MTGPDTVGEIGGVTGPDTAAPVVVKARDGLNLVTEYAAPRTELEQALARLWSQRLGVTPVGVDDDFFHLGGHSLIAAELLVDVAALTGVEVTARVLYLQPSVAELAAAIEAETEVRR